MTNRMQATAAPTVVKLGGIEYFLSPMTDEDMGILDKWVQTKHATTARNSLAEDATEEQKDRTERVALMQASQLSIMSSAGANILGSSVEGWAMIIWTAARKNHPDMTPAAFRKVLADPKTLEYARKEWDKVNENELKGHKKKQDAKAKNKLKKKISQASKRKNRN